MSDDLKDILSGGEGNIDQEKLMEYLNSKLSGKEKHDVEKKMADDPFLSDAVEGLESSKNSNDLQQVVDRLNQQLREQVKHHKEKRNRRKPDYQSWIYAGVIIIILLAVIGFLVIRMLRQ